MNKLPLEIDRLGPELRIWLEKKLLQDLGSYGIPKSDLYIDWSRALQEGHVTYFHGRRLEGVSEVFVRNTSGKLCAEGWFDFVDVSVDEDAEPIVFWLFLDFFENEIRNKVKSDAFLPEHIWNEMTIAQKDYVASTDSKWLRRDPKVQEWKNRLTG
ncbi:MAG: hypothetical protein ACYC5F_11040 [Thermoleophilia bacterium]